MKILNFYSIDNIIINNFLENRKKFQKFEEFGNKVSRILDRFLKKKNPFGEFRRKTFELEESEFKNYSIYSPSKKKKKELNLHRLSQMLRTLPTIQQ